MWNETMQFISSEAITLKIKIAWWSRAIHCDMQPPQKKIPRIVVVYTPTDCSVLLMSAYLSPVNANPSASYKPLFLFKHHLHPLCLLQTLPLKPPFPPQCHIISWSTRWDTKLSPIILTSLWFRSCPIGVEVEKTLVGEKMAAEGEHAAWMHERCTLAPLPPLSYSVSQIRLMAELLWPWDM